jgi:MoxR-like ATPase
MTSNGERELPAPFLRRCLRIDIKPPDEEKLIRVVQTHFLKQMNELPPAQKESFAAFIQKLATALVERRETKNEYVATDQLLNAIYLRLKNADSLEEVLRKTDEGEEKSLLDFVLRAISRTTQL